MAYFKLSQHLFGGNEANDEESQYNRSSGRDSKPGLPECEAVVITNIQRNYAAL